MTDDIGRRIAQRVADAAARQAERKRVRAELNRRRTKGLRARHARKINREERIMTSITEVKMWMHVDNPDGENSEWDARGYCRGMQGYAEDNGPGTTPCAKPSDEDRARCRNCGKPIELVDVQYEPTTAAPADGDPWN